MPAVSSSRTPPAPNEKGPVEPALARVTIYEVALRPWGELRTDARVDDFPYVGTREWRQQQSDNKKSSGSQA